MKWKQHESEKLFGKGLCCHRTCQSLWRLKTRACHKTESACHWSSSCLFSHRIKIFENIIQTAPTLWICDWAIVNFECYALTKWMKQQLCLSYGWWEIQRGKKTRLAECLSFCQVLLGPPHNKETDWQVEKEDTEASMIYCLQRGRSVPTPLAVSISKKPKYMTPSALR